MDPTRLDALAKALASGASRRRVVAGLLGGVLSLEQHSRAPAKDKDKDKDTRCKKDKDCAVTNDVCFDFVCNEETGECSPWAEQLVTCGPLEQCCEGGCVPPIDGATFGCCPHGTRTGVRGSGACCSGQARCVRPDDPSRLPTECECACLKAGFRCHGVDQWCCSGDCVASPTGESVCACSPLGGFCDARVEGAGECCEGRCKPLRPGSSVGICV